MPVQPRPVWPAADKHGRPYAKLSEVRVGHILITDRDFTCIPKGARVEVRKDGERLYIPCADGKHFLDGQLDDRTHTYLIGLHRAPRGFQNLNPERRKAVAQLGGSSVPAHKRSFSVDHSLALRAGSKGGSTSRGGGRPGKSSTPA